LFIALIYRHQKYERKKDFAIFEAMKMNLKTGIALSLIPQIILVKWLGSHANWIENYYSNGVYPFLSNAFRFLLGWIPFSVGDLLYTSLILLAILYLYKQGRSLFKNKLRFLRDIAMVLSIAYFTFHLMWGFNYYRKPIAAKFEIEQTKE
jgi:hypothetical protein